MFDLVCPAIPLEGKIAYNLPVEMITETSQYQHLFVTTDMMIEIWRVSRKYGAIALSIKPQSPAEMT
ncbi:MAG: hypothetical protein F6K00_01615 [Leptolyngbya sp. SIOISBB]|nr:hypothetical protein [Leptolyngbya sp. SIOISBB]